MVLNNSKILFTVGFAHNPELLRQHFPFAKIVVCVREPVQVNVVCVRDFVQVNVVCVRDLVPVNVIPCKVIADPNPNPNPNPNLNSCKAFPSFVDLIHSITKDNKG